jgi:hypothetical protein
MTNLTITATDVSPVEILEQFTGPAAESIAAGQWVRQDANGKIALSNASSSGEIGQRDGMALTGGGKNTAITVVEDGIVDIGNALSAVAIDAKIYLSNTDGTLADSTGTVSKVVGDVTGAWAYTTVDKLLHIKKEAS